MGIFKRFNREQLTLGVAGLLSALLFGWQLTRGGVESGGGELSKVDRVYSISRQSTIELVGTKVEDYLKGRDIWEPPAAGRLPIPEIRAPEPKLGQMTLPPLAPRPDHAKFNLEPMAGKFRTVGSAIQAAPPPGFPSEADIVALKALAEPDLGGIVNKSKQMMRPDGLSIVHRIDNQSPVIGSIIQDTDQTPDGSIIIKEKRGEGTFNISVPAAQINKDKPGTDDGIERGWEYGRDYTRRAKKIKGDDPEAHRKLGEWCREKAGMIPEARKELAAAVEGLRKIGEVGPRMRDAVLYLVEILRESGMYDEAIDALQVYIDTVKGTTNDSAELHLRVGKLYEKLGYHERSLVSYDAAFQLEPGRAPPRIALARARLNLGETQLALDQIDAVLIGGGSVDPEALTVQGLARLKLGLAATAEESFTKALASSPSNDEALNGLGVALALQGKGDAAGKFLAALRANQYQIDAWLNLAILYVAAGRPVEADVLFSGAAQRDPDSTTAAAGPGFVAVLKGAIPEAAAAFERARKIQPDDYYLSYALGRLKLREGKAQEALALFRASLRSNPDYLPATTDAALAYLMLARAEQSLAANAPPDRQAPFRERAAGHRVSAEALLETAYQSDPSSHAANAALGCVYAAMGRVRDALAAFERAVRQDRVDPLLDYGRGYVEYWYGADSPKARLELAEVRFKFGASHSIPDLKDPADVEWLKECAKALQSIEDWRTQRILIEDRFEGNQASLANSWILLGPTPTLQVRFEKDMAVIGDTEGKSPSESFSALEHRDIPRDAFLSIEGTLVFETSQGFVAGFSLYTSQLKGQGAATNATGLHFVFQEDATAASPKPLKLFYGQMPAALQKGPSRPSQSLGVFPAAPTRIRFKLERKEDPSQPKQWIFDFSVWDDAKGAWRLLTEKVPIKVTMSMGDSPTMTMQFWGRTAAEGRKWSVGVDNVRVLVVEKQ